MNENLANPIPQDDDTRFDRLVDGELSPDAYRALLGSFDDEPGGWRRCALAFLEAQALSRELGVIRRSQQIAEPAKPLPVSAPAKSGSRRWKLTLAMAASFLVAFGLGVYLPAWLQTGAGTQLAGPVVPASPSVPATAAPAPPIAAADSHDVVPVGSVRLVVDRPGGSPTETGELPVYEMTDDLAAWLAQDQPAIPASLLAELERRGHHIDRQRQYVPVVLDDGRQAIIPVEGIEIAPVSRRAY